MALTDKGKFIFGNISEKGEYIFNDITENGFFVINATPLSNTNPPNVRIVSVDHYTISNQSGINYSDVTFYFDSDVTNWTVNVIGTSSSSGTIVASGGAVSANTNITVTIDSNQLYQEGSNQINLYGKNNIGWTPYEDNN